MSIWLNEAQATARQKIAMRVAATARPAGDAGVSTISNAAGKNAISSARACEEDLGNAAILLADFMEACLQSIKGGIPAT
jgi:hypothetical protein